MRWSVVAGYNVCNSLENKNSSRGFMFFVKSVIRNNTRVPLKCSRKKLNLNLQHFRNILLQALETSHRVFSTQKFFDCAKSTFRFRDFVFG